MHLGDRVIPKSNFKDQVPIIIVVSDIPLHLSDRVILKNNHIDQSLSSLLLRQTSALW